MNEEVIPAEEFSSLYYRVWNTENVLSDLLGDIRILDRWFTFTQCEGGGGSKPKVMGLTKKEVVEVETRMAKLEHVEKNVLGLKGKYSERKQEMIVKRKLHCDILTQIIYDIRRKKYHLGDYVWDSRNPKSNYQRFMGLVETYKGIVDFQLFKTKEETDELIKEKEKVMEINKRSESDKNLLLRILLQGRKERDNKEQKYIHVMKDLRERKVLIEEKYSGLMKEYKTIVAKREVEQKKQRKQNLNDRKKRNRVLREEVEEMKDMNKSLYKTLEIDRKNLEGGLAYLKKKDDCLMYNSCHEIVKTKGLYQRDILVLAELREKIKNLKEIKRKYNLARNIRRKHVRSFLSKIQGMCYGKLILMSIIRKQRAEKLLLKKKRRKRRRRRRTAQQRTRMGMRNIVVV